MGMFSKLKGKGRDQGASDALVEDIEELAAMSALDDESEPVESQPQDAVAEGAPGPAEPAADASGLDDAPLGDDILGMFEEEEDVSDPLVREMAAEAEEVAAEDLLNEILSLTEALDTA